LNLPNFSRMVNVAQMRYIQSFCEAPDYRNPDAVVGAFLSIQQRLACLARGKLLISNLRAKPFYHYVLARTKYYDEVFLDAVYDSVACIINIGCGSDTRAYRFEHILRRKAISVVECDQPQAIASKQKIARRLWPTDHISYLPLDLNRIGWTGLAQVLDEKIHNPALVMMEGVSPYISGTSFEAFLRFLAPRLHARSVVAYDFKIANLAGDFDRYAHAEPLFRLPAERAEVAAYHNALGLQLQHMELSAELSARLLPRASLLFHRDGLLRLSPCGRASR
jgi:methyltransferase (TIGR00027 family)